MWDPEGHATAAAAVDAHATPTYMVTSGIGAEAVSSTTPHQAGDVRMLVTLLNAWTNYVEPAWSLSLGLKVDRGSSSDAEPRRMSSADLHKLLGKLAEGGALQHAADVAAALERGDLDAVTLFALEAWTEIATDRELVIAVFGLLIGETFEQVAKQVTKALKDAVQRLGTRANAVAFVVTVAADLIFGIPAIVIQQDAFANELRHMPSIASMPPLWWYVARDHHEVIIATNASILEQLTVDEVTIAPLLGRSWTGHYKRVYDWDTGEVLELEGFYPPFSPNTGYPGEDLTFFDGVFSEEYVDVAQPWITDVKPFALEPGAFVEAGVDGHTATFWTVTDAPLLAEVDGTVRGAWLIAAVLTDAHSPEPRWAICRYHVGVEGFTARVDAEYCDQAEHGAVGDTWAFRDFLWTVVDGDLYEWGTDAAETQGSVPGTGSVHEFHRRFAHEAGSGMLEPTYPDQRVSAPILATWTALDIGARIPSETEVLVASGCVPDGVGGWVCPDI